MYVTHRAGKPSPLDNGHFFVKIGGWAESLLQNVYMHLHLTTDKNTAKVNRQGKNTFRDALTIRTKTRGNIRFSEEIRQLLRSLVQK